MEERLEEFKETVKRSFLKVKDHISSIENESRVNKDYIIELKKKLNEISSKLDKLVDFKINKDNSASFDKSSTGNKGVSFIHSFNKHSLNIHSLVMHSENFTDFSKNFQEIFGNLTSREFMVFLSLYQLEEELGPIRYTDISNKLNLSEGCIRSYIAILIKKGIPIVKSKCNNRVVVLSILKEFRDLNLKQKLMNMYYNMDPQQSKLSDPFN